LVTTFSMLLPVVVLLPCCRCVSVRKCLLRALAARLQRSVLCGIALISLFFCLRAAALARVRGRASGKKTAQLSDEFLDARSAVECMPEAELLQLRSLSQSAATPAFVVKTLGSVRWPAALVCASR
jgi:hypothetical protein